MPAPDASTLDLLRRLEQSVSLGPADEAAAVASEPFRAVFAPHTADTQHNYAMPVAPLGDAGALAGSIERLRQLFAERDRTPRVEFMEELWPELAPALERAGFVLENREPLMTCVRADFAPAAAPEVAVRALDAADPDAELAAYLAILDEEEGRAGHTPTAEEIARLRERLLMGGGWCVLARLGGQPAGTGRCQVYDSGPGEVSAIVTRPPLRRRGVAAAVTSFLLDRYFAAGGELAWLSAASPTAQAVYARLGFRAIGSLLNYEAPRHA
jgi:ribosomal protein S18 acetylase RimI-like enzyme